MRRVLLSSSLAVALMVAMAALFPAPSQAAQAAPEPMSCTQATAPGQVACRGIWRPTGATPGISAPTSGGTPGTVSPRASVPSGGFGAQNLQSIYGIAGTSAATAPAGSGPLVAVIDNYHYPQMASDLAAYRSYYGLPACTEDATDSAAGCLREIDETGRAILPGSPSTEPSNDDWSGETSLDLDMVSAVCPSCRLLLISVSSNGSKVNDGIAQAVAQGAQYVSMSFGGNASSSSAKFFTKWPNVLFTAAAGDNGFTGADWPNEATGVVSVGGVSDNAGRLSVWSNQSGATNAGCAVPDSSGYTPPMPAAQAAYPGPAATCGTSRKAETDVSAIADPQTGVAIYTKGQWYEAGGTSASSPIIAALFATAGNFNNPGAIYNNATVNPSLYSDVTSGSICPSSATSRICRAQAGWDGPTGVGMPTSPKAVAVPLPAPKASVSAVSISGRHGQSLSRSFTVTPTTTAQGSSVALRLVTSAAGLPAGLSARISGSTVTISGTATGTGSGTATVRVGGTTSTGQPSGMVPVKVTWKITKQAFAAKVKPKVTGTRKPGHTVKVKLPALYANALTGPQVKPGWSVAWLLNGKVVHHGTSYKLPSSAAGKKLKVKVTASKSGFASRTWTTTAAKVS